MLHRALVHSSVISRWPPMLRRFPLMVYRLCPPRAIPARFSFRFEPLDRRKGTRVAVTRRRRSRLPRFRSSVSRGPSTVRQDASSRRDAPSSIPPRRRGHTRAYVHGTNPIFFFSPAATAARMPSHLASSLPRHREFRSDFRVAYASFWRDRS